MDTKKLESLPNSGRTANIANAHIIVELIEYEHNAMVSKSILKKATGTINALSFDAGEGLNERTNPHDTYVQIIDGSAIIEINGKPSELTIGQGILIPANVPNLIQPNGRFKLILTVIKNNSEVGAQ